MKTKISTILLSGFAIVITVATFSLSVENNSLESLRASAKMLAGTKCVPATNSDCLSVSTNQIYIGYRKATIGGGLGKALK
ncbi:hypothetical protein CMU93_02455 [Elizabethkingia anophelis]|nr:hypothetical protein [Elizabethkingia anophelis]